jgi:hypothetical protein
MDAVTIQFPAILNTIDEIATNEVDEETKNLILLPHKIVIPTIILYRLTKL